MVAVWNVANVRDSGYPPLRGDSETEVAIIGAGITGLTLALQLAEAGKQVLVLEAGRVGESNTGGSTGNLYSTVSDGLSGLRTKWGDDVTADVVEARGQAVDLIERTVERFGIECQFERRPLYQIVPTDTPQLARALDEERHALRCAGLELHGVENKLHGFNVHRGLKLENQAQFNPLSYARGLARAATEQGARIYEKSVVRDIEYKPGIVKTDSAEVRANHIVHATHSPKGIDLLQTGMMAYREHGVSAKLNSGAYPEGIFWVKDPFHSIRSYHYRGNDYIIAIGEKHKVGGGTQGTGYYDNLRKYLGEHFDVQRFEHQWSAQQFTSADGLPYIGKMFGVQNAYTATGFAADGLTWGSLAGMIISDLILDRDNPWSKRFDASRFTPAKSLKGWAKENAHVTKHLAQDYLNPARVKRFDDVAPGQGKVVAVEGEKLAVYRDNGGELSVVSAICTHMKCVVHWNGADTSWDCPCHGSRFKTDGSVIEGPAFHPLAPPKLPQKTTE